MFLLQADSSTFFSATLVSGDDDCSRDVFRLSTQSDADSLVGCLTLTEDVVITSAAEGSINLGDVLEIKGSLTNQQCSDACGAFETLVCDDLVNITAAISLNNLADVKKLKKLSFRDLETVGDGISIDNLPSLETLDLTKLSSAGSISIRHAQRLTRLGLPSVEHITGDEAKDASFFEFVDLAIDQWAFIKVRQTLHDDGHRRLGRVFARDLPSSGRFAFNNADAIGTIEAHGLPHQMAALDLDKKGPHFEHSTDRRFDKPVCAVGNLTLAGFGGNFTAPSFPDASSSIGFLSIASTTMIFVLLGSVTKLKTLSIIDNADLELFSTPADMHSWTWETIEFRGNPKLKFHHAASSHLGYQ